MYRPSEDQDGPNRSLDPGTAETLRVGSSMVCRAISLNPHKFANMQGKWEPNQFRQLTMGTFLFTAEQSRLMRAQAQMRTRAQAENGDIAVALSSDTKVHQ